MATIQEMQNAIKELTLALLQFDSEHTRIYRTVINLV